MWTGWQHSGPKHSIPHSLNFSSRLCSFFLSLRHPHLSNKLKLATLSCSLCSHSLGGVALGSQHLPLWLRRVVFWCNCCLFVFILFHRTSWWSRGKPSQCITATGNRSLKTGFAMLWVLSLNLSHNITLFFFLLIVTKIHNRRLLQCGLYNFRKRLKCFRCGASKVGEFSPLRWVFCLSVRTSSSLYILPDVFWHCSL